MLTNHLYNPGMPSLIGIKQSKNVKNGFSLLKMYLTNTLILYQKIKGVLNGYVGSRGKL